MAILVTKATNPTNTYTLGSTDTDNTIYGSNVAETFTFNGTGNLSIADVAGADVLNLTNVSPVAGVTIAVTGNNVILTTGTGATLKTYTLGAVNDGEAITVNFGNGSNAKSVLFSRAGDVFSYKEGNSAIVPVTDGILNLGTFDTTPPVVTITTPTTTNDTTPVISGTTEANSTVTVTIGTQTYITTADTTTGSWAVGVTTPLTNGNHTISVTAVDLAGNASAAAAEQTLTIDTAAKATATPVENGSLLTNGVNETEAGGNIVITAGFGTTGAQAGDTIELLLNGVSFGSVITHTLTTDDITATFYDFTVAGSALGNDGTKLLSTKVSTFNTIPSSPLSFVVDKTLPTLTNVELVSSNANPMLAKPGDTVTLHFTADEALGATPTATILGQSATVTKGTGNTYTATYTVANSDTEGAATFSIGFADAAGNAGTSVTAVTNASAVNIDHTAPTLNSIALSDTALKIGETSPVTFTFSEAVTGFDVANDVAAPNGTFGALSAATNNGDGTQTYTALFTPTASFEAATNLITVTNSGFSDLAGNAGASTTVSANYEIDTLAPNAPTGITLSTLGGSQITNTINATNTTFNVQATITAGQATGGSAILKVNGTTVATDSEILAGDTAVTFTSAIDAAFNTTVPASGTVTIDLIDVAGNVTTSVANPTLTVDYVAPTAPDAPAVTVTGGTIVSNTLNGTNTNLTVTAAITAGQATGGTAYLKLGTTTIATVDAISAADTSVSFNLGTFSTTGLQAKIAAGGNLTVVLEDTAGNIATSNATALTVDYVVPAQTLSNLALSADTGVVGDFNTKTNTQTITATLSGVLVSDKVYGSLDNGTNWTEITNKVSGTTLSWDSATLVDSNTLKIKIADAAGNEKQIASQSYVLDTAAPATPTFALRTDTGLSNSDHITSDAVVIVSGFEVGATWAYLTDGGTTFTTGGAISNGSASFSLPAGTLASGNIKIKQIDSVGNDSAVVANTSAITVDATAPTAPTVIANNAFKGNAIINLSNAAYTTGLTLGTSERIWLAPSVTTVFTANDTTITNSTTTTIHLPTTAGDYKLFHEDAAGNISNGSTVTIAVDNTAPTSTISSVKYIQQNGSDVNVIRLTGSGFDTIGNSDLTTQLDLTKLVWNVDDLESNPNKQQVITAADIQSITKASDTQIDIVLNASNALYNHANFLTGGTGAFDTLAITEGFIRDKAGNAAITDELLTTVVDTTTAYAMTLTDGATVSPTIYVPNIELTAPATGTTAAFSGLNLKAIPTTLLSIVGIQAGQTVTVNNLQKMDYVNAPNTISFTSTATTATTEKVVIDLTGAKALNFNNPYNVKTDITFAGGGAYMQLGSGVDYIELKTLAPAAGVGNLLLDYVENFTTGIDRVNLNQAMLTSLSGTTSADFTSGTVTDVPDANGDITSATVTFTGVDNTNKTNLAVTGTNLSTVTLGTIIDGNGTDTPESVTVTFSALTNDQTFTLNGVTIVAPSIGLTAHEVATLFANQMASTLAVINQIEVGSNPPSTMGNNIWISDIDGTISYDVDGDWNAGAIQLISVVTQSLGNILSTDLYLV
jgi:hypothetical protein